MKKNIGNDKVIRAMAIGISAMLAASTPLTALAAEGEEGTGNTNPDPAGETNTTSSKEMKAAKDAVDEASKATGTAQESATTIKTDVETNVETNVVAGEANDSEGNDLAQNVIDAAKKVENTTVEGGSSVADAKDNITIADGQLVVAEANDGLSDAALGTATKEAGNAAGIAADVNDAMDKANATVDEKIGEIENATTIADANAAYSELEATANAAQEEFNAKLDAYNTAKAEYEAADAKVKEYEDAYNDAIANADANAAEAQAKLKAAQANAAALEAAVAAAKDAVDESASAAMAIVELEALTKDDNKDGKDVLNWKNEDKLFIAIMENYYLPETQGIQGATVKRVQGWDNNEYNYFAATYKDENGQEQIKYFNFKMDKDENGKDSKSDIVIFEKRIEEVDWEKYQKENPDQYVKDSDNKTVVDVADVAAGLENGTIVDADGKYYEYGSKEGETLVTDSNTKTENGEVDVIVDKNESNYEYTWQYDEETGELVKTVIGDVTTITYTNASLTSDQYATEKERNDAATAKKKELEEKGGIKDVTISTDEKTTYVATGTYIPTFTKTITITEDDQTQWVDDSVRDVAEKAKRQAVQGELEDLAKDNHEEYYLVSYNSEALKADRKHNGWFGDKYKVTGTTTVTYAKVTTKKVSLNSWDAFLSDLGLSDKKEVTKEDVKNAIQSKGGEVLEFTTWDWNLKTATVKYLAGAEIKTDEQVSDEAARAALADSLADKYNAKEEDTLETNTTYSYTVDYLEKTSEKTENKEIATETYGNAIGLSGQIIQNKNYKDGNILLTQKDEGYRAFVDDAKALTGKYDRLLKEAQTANEDVKKAQDQVNALQDAIEALKDKHTNSTALAELEAKLLIAQADRDEAEETLNEILKKLEGAGVTLDDVIGRLTPPTTPGGDDGTTGGGTGTGTTTTTTLVAGNVVAAPVATTTTTTTTPAPAAANVVAIEDEDTPLAATVDEAGDDANESGDEDQNAIVAIEDEETPLVASVEKDKVSWWWWLILVILGATGYEMYRKHQEKKKAAAEAEDAE